MRTAVTLCRVPEAAAGPFVFHDELAVGFQKAAAIGFDAVELFLPGPDEVAVEEIQSLCEKHGLAIAAVGTGAGMVKHGLSLTDPVTRDAALAFIIRMIEFGGQLGAPAILGSMQGRHGGDVSRNQALAWLDDSLQTAGETAARFNVPFIYEPLNRYETNLFNQAAPAAAFLRENGLSNVKLLADLFHMAIEEKDIATALVETGDLLGHVHWADSNRHAAGFGHMDFKPIAEVLENTGYAGYLSAEILPLPTPDEAAKRTMASIRELFP
ncbi:MAG TPA: sugar phosphate isomerase/epimerase family protein [Luteolibacter sp.]|nr:sugar phosphate isomerase/epimerase family protein [Luteolibacter sp.]